jgi:hypothetical protein
VAAPTLAFQMQVTTNLHVRLPLITPKSNGSL